MEDTIKPKNSSKMKEKRVAYSQDGASKKNSKHQGLITNDMLPLSPPQTFDGGSPVKKLLNEAGKIMKIGMEKDFALFESDVAIQNSNETIDNLRKNILHLQMEYEKLDQNYQREISYRIEIVNRMDATGELVDSVVQCSNILDASIKQLEEDKLKIAELYELIFQNQKQIEGKHAQTEKFIQEQDMLVQNKLEEIKEFQTKFISKNSETVSQLSHKLTYTSEKLKTTIDENEKLQREIQEIQESSNRLQIFLEQQEKLNNLNRENMTFFKINLKKLKIQKFKYQKLLKSKKKEFSYLVIKNKNLKKSLEKIELLYNECILMNASLESKNNELATNFDKHLLEDEDERKNWDIEKKELINKLTDKESQIEDLKNLSGKISEMLANEEAKRLEFEKIQNELSSVLNENLTLKDNVKKLNEENDDKGKRILELETKTNGVEAGLNSKIEFYKNEAEKSNGIVRELESRMSDLEKRLLYEKSQKENLLSEFNAKLEQSLKGSNEEITDLKKQLEDKDRKIQFIESEKTHADLDGKAILKKLNSELQLEKFKNNELSKNLECVENSFKTLKKQLEDTKYEIREKEDKLTELNALNKTLRHTQNDLEKKVESLKKECEIEKKSFEVLEEKHKKCEKELRKLEKISEEYEAFKSTTGDLKNVLETTEARLEAYKVVVKKLESERVEIQNNHSEEVTKLKLELSRLEEAIKKDKIRFRTPQKSVETENVKESKDLSSQKQSTKENEPEVGDIEKWNQTATPPIQGGKKFLSTPRKVFTSTPQSTFRNLTPLQAKKRDPYEFDSDSSAERFDPSKVLKVFNRQKKEGNKRTKTTK